MVYNDFTTAKGLLKLPLWLIAFIILSQRLRERFYRYIYPPSNTSLQHTVVDVCVKHD